LQPSSPEPESDYTEIEKIGYEQCETSQNGDLDAEQKSCNSTSDGKNEIEGYEQFNNADGLSDSSGDWQQMEIEVEKPKVENGKLNVENGKLNVQQNVELKFKEYWEDLDEKWGHLKIDHERIKADMAKINFSVEPSWAGK
jgi:hypothetical protein